MAETKWKQLSGLGIELGVFQGAADELGRRQVEDLAARASVKVLGIAKVSAGAYLAEVLDGTRRFGVSADLELKANRLRMDLEAFGGRLAIGAFSGAMGLLAYRLWEPGGGWTLQPVVGAELLRIQGPVSGQGHSGTIGVNALLEDTFKIQLQLERALAAGDQRPGTRVAAQLAGRF
jgi:hypothetical protein